MTDTPQTTTFTRADVHSFMRLRTSTRRGLAERFGLDLRPEISESDFDKTKGWLLEAKALGRLDDILIAAREAKP